MRKVTIIQSPVRPSHSRVLPRNWRNPSQPEANLVPTIRVALQPQLAITAIIIIVMAIPRKVIAMT